MTDPCQTISVVIVSLVGGDALGGLLGSLKPAADECLVLLDEGNNVSQLREQFPAVQFVSRQDLSVPMARKRGAHLASGDIVALLEDTSLPAPGWRDAVVAAFSRPGVVAAGGPVLLAARLGARFLALGSAEYGRFHPDRISRLVDEPEGSETIPEGLLPVTRLPGNNIAYRRAPLMEMLSQNESGLIEGEVNEALMARGFNLYIEPAMVVTYGMADEHGARLRTRFNHGRLFAGNRIAGQGAGARIGWFLKSLLLPFVLTTRGWSNMTASVAAAAWPKVMAWILLMETAWSVGEAVGYLRGPGRSLDAWH
ncbi:MAG: hypothetical protein HKO55_02005 [Gammaproteobacteria bacterium]|nr:hypothetical protein [Gammaproteobacteria bacterium]